MKNLKAQVTSSTTSPGSTTALLSTSQIPPVWWTTGTSNCFSSVACKNAVSRVSNTTSVPIFTCSKSKTIAWDFSSGFQVTVCSPSDSGVSAGVRTTERASVFYDLFNTFRASQGDTGSLKQEIWEFEAILSCTISNNKQTIKMKTLAGWHISIALATWLEQPSLGQVVQSQPGWFVRLHPKTINKLKKKLTVFHLKGHFSLGFLGQKENLG